MSSRCITMSDSSSRRRKCDPGKANRADIAAELRGAGGEFLSKGLANFYSDDRPTFRPLDAATVDTIRSRAEILFLTDTNQSLPVHQPKLCEAPLGGQPLHFHLTLKCFQSAS